MKNNKLAGFLFGLSGLAWIINAIVSRDWTFIPIGLCFVTLGIVFAKNQGEE